MSILSEMNKPKKKTHSKLSSIFNNKSSKLDLFKLPKEKDSKRSFTNLQKNSVYDAQKGLCAKCKKPVKSSIAEYHHIKFHSTGGKSKLNNCQMLCPNCHREIHKMEMVKKADKKRKPKDNNLFKIKPMKKIKL
jgi:5-methylcytosine-specific restriction endonuclease McrA